MNKSFLIIFLFMSEIAFSQKVVVGLNKINTIYKNLRNPLDIAVEGYTRDQITVTALGCVLEKDSITSQYYLKPGYEVPCKVMISYKKGTKQQVDTIHFKIEDLPRPKSQFGNLESGGSNRINELMNQTTIEAVMPDFHIEQLKYKVLHFSVLYVPKSINEGATAYSQEGNIIPKDLKNKIMAAKSGDKILIDEIKADGPGGMKKRLAPIVITVAEEFEDIEGLPNYYISYQTPKDSANTNFDWNTNSNLHNFKPGITKGFKINCCDTQLVFEIKVNPKKILYERHYYTSGKLKAEYNFENNDSLGKAICYYENGNFKSLGKVLIPSKNIYTRYRDFNQIFAGVAINYEYTLKDSFFIHNYVPYGHWLCYGENGKILMDCNLSIFNHGKIPMNHEDAEFDLSLGNKKRKQSSVKEALKNNDGYYKVAFNGPFKIFNKEGMLLNETFYNYKTDWYCKLIAMNDYYVNGNLKEQVYFSNNDTFGYACTYYENGELKSKGKIISDVINIRNEFSYPDSLTFLDSFIIYDYPKIGAWKGYYQNGRLALDCNFKVWGWLELEKELIYGDGIIFYDEDIETKEYSVDETMRFPENGFYSRISGPCKIYNEQGKLVKEIDFKN